MKPFKKGDPIRIRPEWQDPGDGNFEHYADSDEEKGRVDMVTVIPGWTFLPVSTVFVYMLEPNTDTPFATN